MNPKCKKGTTGSTKSYAQKQIDEQADLHEFLFRHMTRGTASELERAD